MATLVGIPFSPWTVRARLALKRQAVPYTFRLYTPMLSEPRVRLELGVWRGPVSVPVLLRDDGPPLRDSFDIVCWGAERSQAPLVTPSNRDEVARWNAVSDTVLAAGRVRTTLRVAADREALRDSVPPPMNRLGPVAELFGRVGVGHLLRRYPAGTAEACRQRMVEGLDAIREALGGRETLLDGPSYADITCAVALSFVAPHARAPLGPRARLGWTEPDLAEAYADLLAWRDRVYALS